MAHRFAELRQFIMNAAARFIVILLLAVISSVASAVSINTDVGRVSIGFSIGGGVNYYRSAQESISVRKAAHPSFAWGGHISTYLTQHFGLEAGYTNFGFYENAGDGYADCDATGNCNYDQANLPTVFSSAISLSNEITNEAFYLTTLWHWMVAENQYAVAKLGASYNVTRIRSFVTVSPEVLGIGPTFHVEQTSYNQQKIFPYIDLGWRYHFTSHISVTSDIVWNGMVKLYNSKQVQGTLYPIAIMMGLDYTF